MATVEKTTSDLSIGDFSAVFGLPLEASNASILVLAVALGLGVLCFTGMGVYRWADANWGRYFRHATESARDPVRKHHRKRIRGLFGFDIYDKAEHFRKRIRARAEGGRFSDSDRLAAALALIASLRNDLKPTPLSFSNIPKDLDVIGFDPHGKFRVRTVTPIGFRIAIGLLCLPYYLIISGFLFSLLDASFVGGLVGFSLWIWRNLRGSYVSIDFANRKYALIGPASARWYSGYPRVCLKTVETETVWTTTLSIADYPVIERSSDVAPANEDLAAFVNALNWHMGKPAEIADGIFIAPEPAS